MFIFWELLITICPILYIKIIRLYKMLYSIQRNSRNFKNGFLLKAMFISMKQVPFSFTMSKNILCHNLLRCNQLFITINAAYVCMAIIVVLFVSSCPNNIFHIFLLFWLPFIQKTVCTNISYLITQNKWIEQFKNSIDKVRFTQPF